MRVCRTYKVLPNICVKLESSLKKAAGRPGAFAWTINARIMREKLVAICYGGDKERGVETKGSKRTIVATTKMTKDTKSIRSALRFLAWRVESRTRVVLKNKTL